MPQLDLLVLWRWKGRGASAGFGCFVGGGMKGVLELDLVILWRWNSKVA